MPPTVPEIRIGDAVTAAGRQQYHRSLRGYGHITGGPAQAVGDLDVELPSDASVWIDGTEVDVSTTGHMATVEAHPDLPRWATIVVEDTGNVRAINGDVNRPRTVDNVRVTGRQAPRPQPPVVTDPDRTVYAFVWVPSNASSIEDEHVVDRRIDARLDAYNFSSDNYTDGDAVAAVEAASLIDLSGNLIVNGEAAITGSLTVGGEDIATESWADGVFAAAAHGNSAHTETYAVDGDAQPPEDHGNGAHTEDFVTSAAGEYEIQKDGTDGMGVLNFKTQ